MMEHKNSGLLMVSEAARLLGRSSDMVRYYERTGRLLAVRTAGGVRLFEREAVERFAATLGQAGEVANDDR